MLKYLDFRAIGLGVLANIGFSMALGILASIVAVVVLTAQGYSANDVDAIMGQPWQVPGLYMFYLLVGAVSDYCAGVITAKFARSLEYYQTCAMMLFMASLSLLIGADDIPAMYLLGSISLGFGAAFLGARRVKVAGNP